MFIHGLWLSASPWDPWRATFDAAGFRTIAPTWPGEAPSIPDTRAHAEDQAGNGIDEITAHSVGGYVVFADRGHSLTVDR